jgi:hypothetical protein
VAALEGTCGRVGMGRWVWRVGMGGCFGGGGLGRGGLVGWVLTPKL